MTLFLSNLYRKQMQRDLRLNKFYFRPQLYYENLHNPYYRQNKYFEFQRTPVEVHKIYSNCVVWDYSIMDPFWYLPLILL